VRADSHPCTREDGLGALCRSVPLQHREVAFERRPDETEG